MNMNPAIKIKTIVILRKVLGNNLIYPLPLNYFIGGSSCLDFIDDPNNINVIAVYQEHPLNGMNEQIKNAIDSISKENKIDFVLVKEDEPTVYDWLYANSYINIFGTDEYKLNLFNKDNLIIDLIKEHYNRFKDNKQRLFEVIYYYFIRSNGRYELYPYQKQILANWHKGNYDEELLERVVNELGLEGD